MIYLGLAFVSKYIFPIYSPKTPKQINCTPPIKQIKLVILAQPLTVFSIRYMKIDQITPTKLNKAIKQPTPVIIRIGLMLRLVIPSKANANIFFNG